MKPRGRSLGWTIGLLAALTLMAGAPCGAASSPSTNLATLATSPSEVTWSPQAGNFESFVLTISTPDGTVLRREFAGSETPTFSLFDAGGSLRQDGVYHYELRALPKVSAALRQQLAAARGESGGTALGHPMPMGELPDLVQSGSFAIQDGALISAGKRETPSDSGLQKVSAGGISKITAAGTVLTNADGIIRNSLCVGFDCPNSPTFSDTTILLMENNTRIKFDDTSTISGFPNRDWAINANDSASGGSNRFWVQDCGNSSQGGCSGNAVFSIEAGARNNALYVDNSGRLGLGTSNPVVDVHTTRGDTPTLRLEQNGSSGFAPQTWDVAGNETSFFIRDATNGSTLPFRIRPGAPSSAIDIAASGNVGIGKASATDKLQVVSSSNPTNGQVFVENTSGTAADRNMIRLKNNGPPTLFFANTNAASNGNWTYTVNNSGQFQISAVGSGTGEFQISAGGNANFAGTVTAVSFNPTSSKSVKENFQELDPKVVLDRLLGLHISEWSYKGFPGRHIGPFAEDFRATFDLGIDSRHISLLDAAGVTMAALQGLNERLQERDRKIDDLEKENRLLEERLTRLEQVLQTRAQE